MPAWLISAQSVVGLEGGLRRGNAERNVSEPEGLSDGT